MRIVKNGRVVENVPLILNLLKDSSWCYAWVWVGTIAVVPILSYQIYSIWKCRGDVHATIGGIVSGMILSANAIWMFGDFYFGQDHFRNVARWLFSIGMIFGLIYMLFSLRKGTEDQVMVHEEVYYNSRFRHLYLMRHARQVKELRNHVHRSK